jgi:hypothetical protein
MSEDRARSTPRAGPRGKGLGRLSHCLTVLCDVEEIHTAQAPLDSERAALVDLDRQVRRLVDAVAHADDVPELVARLRETRAARRLGSRTWPYPLLARPGRE